MFAVLKRITGKVIVAMHGGLIASIRHYFSNFSNLFMKSFIQIILLFSFIFSACKVNSDKHQPPVIVKLPPITADNGTQENEAAPHSSYDINKPDQSWKLPKKLVEVSGNTWVDKDHLILIDDNYSELYLINISDKSVNLEKTIPFQKNNKDKLDIEDVALVGDVVYALSSHGILYKIDNWKSEASNEEIKTFLSGKNDTEGLGYDPVTKNLLVACKDESGLEGEKKSTKAVYEFDVQTKKLKEKPFLIIREDDFKKLTKDKIDFNPSAIAVHPTSHEIYLISTRGDKCMAVYNRDGKLLSFQQINKDLMEQPEGFCFSPDGKLYISSEGKKGDAADLFLFNAK